MNQDLLADIDDVIQLAVDTGLMWKACIIQQHDGTMDAGGAPVPGDAHWDDVISAHCMAAPTADTGVSATESKSLIEMVSTSQQHTLLDGYYPGIVSSMRAKIDGIVYDILGVEDDSQKTMTRMEVRLTSI